MDVSPALSSALATLTQALDCDGIDLAAQLADLAANLRPASLGMTITISGNGDPVTFGGDDVARTWPAEPPPTMQLSPIISADPSSSFPRFESHVDVYIDVPAGPDAAGIDTTALGRAKGMRTLTAGPDLPDTLQRCSAINQAIGVLLERRRTPEAAHEDLARLANFGRTDLYHAAEYVLRDLAGHHPTNEGAPAAA